MSKKKLKTLVLKNSEWLRGKGAGLLFVPIRGYLTAFPRKLGGKMCCLGILGCALEIPKRAMSKQTYPSNLKLSEYYDKWPVTPSYTTLIYNSVGAVNDNACINDAERLKRLAPLFAELGYRLVFDKDA